MRRQWLLALVLLGLTACSPKEPIRLGFLGGLSGRIADLGMAGRNGAQLAIDDVNAEGGVNGRSIELLVHDDEQNEAQAVRAVVALSDARVHAIVGPMTSSIAEAIRPTINASGTVAVSPTVTASTLSGLDDSFFKVAPSVAENCSRSTAYLHAKGLRRVAIAYDLSNRAFSVDWFKNFGQAFEALGGQVVAHASFTSGDDTSYGGVMSALIAGRPDFLLFVANAVDTVRLTQLARNQGHQLPIAASSWSATENLIQLGGRTVDGMTLTQFFDRDDHSARYQAFARTYRERFKQEPGFASVAAYDAVRATLQAIGRTSETLTLKQALLSAGPYQGLQEEWNFDAHGDARRRTRVTVVQNGRFALVD